LSAEQDTRCAEILGWHRGANSAISGIAGRESSAYWYDADGKRCAPYVTDAFANMYPFAPSTNHEHARVLEDAIARLDVDHQRAYALALRTEVDDGQLSPHGPMATTWFIIRATPAQRTAAFIAAMEGSD